MQGKAAVTFNIFSHSAGMGRGGWSEARRREASIPHASMKPTASNPYGNGKGNQWLGRGGKGKMPDTQPKREAVFPAMGCVCGWRAGNRRALVLAAEQGRMGHAMHRHASHASAFPRALARPPLSPGIRAGNVGEELPESRHGPAAGSHGGTRAPAALRARR